MIAEAVPNRFVTVHGYLIRDPAAKFESLERHVIQQVDETQLIRAAVTDRSIAVHSWQVNVRVKGNMKWLSGSTVISGSLSLEERFMYTNQSTDDVPTLVTADGEALNLDGNGIEDGELDGYCITYLAREPAAIEFRDSTGAAMHGGPILLNEERASLAIAPGLLATVEGRGVTLNTTTANAAIGVVLWSYT